MVPDSFPNALKSSREGRLFLLNVAQMPAKTQQFPKMGKLQNEDPIAFFSGIVYNINAISLNAICLREKGSAHSWEMGAGRTGGVDL